MNLNNRTRAEDLAYKAGVRQAWAAGDYHRFASDLVWDLGAELVSACGIRPGDRVLDVAAGSGNVALRAAAAGAAVVASDLTPENFAAGRRAAQRAGLAIDWVQADAEDLPFADAEFDGVTSSVGAMWAPDHQLVADELVRVCRPGGTIGMINFAADGLLAGFLDVFAAYAPPPPSWASPPLLWGDPDHIRQLFGARVSTLEIIPGTYTERVPGGPGTASTTSKPSGRSPRSTPHSHPDRPPPLTATSWPSPPATTPAPQAGQQNWTTSTSGSSPAPAAADSKPISARVLLPPQASAHISAAEEIPPSSRPADQIRQVIEDHRADFERAGGAACSVTPTQTVHTEPPDARQFQPRWLGGRGLTGRLPCSITHRTG